MQKTLEHWNRFGLLMDKVEDLVVGQCIHHKKVIFVPQFSFLVFG